jgi:hypothetical protein
MDICLKAPPEKKVYKTYNIFGSLVGSKLLLKPARQGCIVNTRQCYMSTNPINKKEQRSEEQALAEFRNL